jgi:peptidoglycan/LPS O-acetylase OafA/YrhL
MTIITKSYRFLRALFVRPSDPLSNDRTNYYPVLTGLRALAAYSVFLLHFNPFSAKDVGWDSLFFALFNELHIGVAVFFTLSGFLIAFRYYDKDFEFNRNWFIRYFQNRVARIYPMYFLLTTLTFTVMSIGAYAFDGGLFLANITFVRGFFDDWRFTGIGPGWSLTVEECFYFSAPLMFMLSRKIKLYQQALILISIGAALVGVSQLTGAYHWAGFFGSFRNVMVYTFFGRCVEFIVGIHLAVMFRRFISSPLSFSSGYFTLLGNIWIATCLAGMAAFKTPDLAQGLMHPCGIVINNLFLPLGVAALFWGLLTEKTFLRTFLETPLMELLGKSSYVFYLIHFGVISTFLHGYFSERALLPMFIALNIVSVILFKYIEEPLNHWIRRQNWTKTPPLSKIDKTLSVEEVK